MQSSALFEARVLAAVAVAASLQLGAPSASAQPSTVRDQGVTPSTSGEHGAPPLPWHDTLFVWDHSATTQTFGVGADYQSSNPTYEMTFRVAPRYYFIDRKGRSLSVRGDLRLLREFTNSDTTTDRGEWTFGDAELWLADVETVHDSPGQHTDFVLRAPVLTFPTSKVSVAAGRILGLGLGLGLDHRVPLRGEGASVLPLLLLRPRLNYSYQFVDTAVPANDTSLHHEHFSLDPGGAFVPSDQVSGSALPQHLLSASLRADTGIVSDLTLVTEIGMRYARRYALPDPVSLCGVVATGCTVVGSPADAPRWGVSTLFALSLAYAPTPYFEVSGGYVNLSGQLGADGRRRSVFYSPDARGFLAFTVALDALYQRARGQDTGEPLHSAGRLVGPRL